MRRAASARHSRERSPHRGWDLVLVARDEARLESEAERYRRAGRQVEVLRADLADRADVARVAERLEDAARPVDLLVNNAGFSVRASLLSTDQEAHDRAFEVMVRAVQVLSGAAGRAMTRRGRGRIVNVGSTAGRITMGAYSAIKAWVTVYTEGLANELGGHRGHRDGARARLGAHGVPCPCGHQRVLDAGRACGSTPTTWSPRRCKDLSRGRVISTPSARYKALMLIARHAPRSGIRRVSKALSGRRSSSLPE